MESGRYFVCFILMNFAGLPINFFYEYFYFAGLRFSATLYYRYLGFTMVIFGVINPEKGLHSLVAIVKLIEYKANSTLKFFTIGHFHFISKLIIIFSSCFIYIPFLLIGYGCIFNRKHFPKEKLNKKV